MHYYSLILVTFTYEDYVQYGLETVQVQLHRVQVNIW